MMSVDSNFNFLCGRPHGAGLPPVHMRPPEPDPLPPPCGRHKWMAPIATIQEASGCCKTILMFCANASYKLSSCTLHNTYFVSTLLRLFIGLTLPRPHMYAESHWRYHTFERHYTCSCSKLRHKAHQKV